MSLRRSVAALLVAVIALASVTSSTAAAQDLTLQEEIIVDVVAQGWWDETGTISAADMEPVVAEWGAEFAFAFTDRELAVQEDPSRNAAALLAQSTLEQLAIVNGPPTLLLVTGDNVGGASTHFPFLNLMSALDGFDRGEPVQAFESAAKQATALGDVVISAEPAQTGAFSGTRIFILLGVVTGVLALLSLRSGRKKKHRRVHTADARTNTNVELQEMSDLILDLDPRVTIANDAKLKERYVDASSTYREVLEHAEGAQTGHEVADLRIEIAKARWKLDVIDAELEGRAPPPEPFARDVSGSAWDSTRGDRPTGP